MSARAPHTCVYAGHTIIWYNIIRIATCFYLGEITFHAYLHKAIAIYLDSYNYLQTDYTFVFSSMDYAACIVICIVTYTAVDLTLAFRYFWNLLYMHNQKL